MGQGAGVADGAPVDAGGGLPGAGVWACVVGAPVGEGAGAPVRPGVGVSVGDGGADGVVEAVAEAGADSVAVSGAGWGLGVAGLLVTGVWFTGMLAVAGGRTSR
jgi:hypothetical protein